MACRLDGYKRNISVLNSRLQETFPEEEQLSDLGSLIRIIQQQREFCEALSFRNFFLEGQSGVRSVVRVSRSGIGRPTVELSQALLRALHDNVGFSWAQIARNHSIEFWKEQFDAKGINSQCQTASRLVTYMTLILIKLSVKFYIKSSYQQQSINCFTRLSRSCR